MENVFDLAVIGAGASGLTAAAVAAENGLSVLLLDNAETPAKKVMISGGGKCNFTNKFVSPDHYLSKNPHFCKSALARLKPEDVLAAFKNAGIPFSEREDGKFFANSAENVKNHLLSRAKKAGALFRFKEDILNLEPLNAGFRISCKTKTVNAAKVLVSTGSPACPAAGGNSFGFKLAKKLSINVIAPEPALVPLRFPENPLVDFSGLAGISLDVKIKCSKKSCSAPLLFTHKGISGPAVLTASLYHDGAAPLSIDFFPEGSLAAHLKTLKENKDKRKISSVLCDFFPQRLALRFAALLPDEKKNAPLAEIPDKLFFKLENTLKNFPFPFAGTEGFEKAEVAKGGIDTKEINSATMESERVPGLYFSGEVLDVTGEVGGYNLHWAWASGTAAAFGVLKSLR